MSVTTTYTFISPADYTYDHSEIEVLGGVAKLNLQDDPKTFNQSFINDVGFSYDSNKAEFVGGLVRQKNTRPTNATFGANYNTNINGNWGDGVLTGNAIGGAGVSGGRLDLTGGGKYVNYNADLNADSQQVGCIKLKYIPNFTGTPPSDYPIFNICRANGDSKNSILLRHESGNLKVYITDNLGVTITSTSLPSWSVVSGTEYEIELNYDLTIGETRVFINGVQWGTTITATGIRDANINSLNIGSNYNNIQFNNCYIEDFVVFSTVQHNANYTSGYTIEDYVYNTSRVELPQFSYGEAGNIQAYTNIVTTEAGSPKEIWNDLYWNGSIWTISDGSYSQANTKTEILTNIATFPTSDTLDIDIVFPNSNSVQNNIDDLTITFTGQIYSINNPKIYPVTTLEIELLESFIATITEAGSDLVKFTIEIDGEEKYWTGATWAVSAGYAQSNSASEINANLVNFPADKVTMRPIIYLHSNNGQTTPNIDELVTVCTLDEGGLPTTPTYITSADFRIFTRVTAQKTLTNVQINPYILHAEQIIDSYIGYVDPADSNQILKFPTLNKDGESYFPRDLQKACIEIVSDLILKGDPSSSSGNIKSESWNSSGYSRAYEGSAKTESVSIGIPPIALRLLRQWSHDVAPATY